MLAFSDGLSLIISRLSLISNKEILLSWAKILKLSKEGKNLRGGKWSQTAHLFDSLTFFPVKADITTCVFRWHVSDMSLSFTRHI